MFPYLSLFICFLNQPISLNFLSIMSVVTEWVSSISKVTALCLQICPIFRQNVLGLGHVSWCLVTSHAMMITEGVYVILLCCVLIAFRVANITTGVISCWPMTNRFQSLMFSMPNLSFARKLSSQSIFTPFLSRAYVSIISLMDEKLLTPDISESQNKVATCNLDVWNYRLGTLYSVQVSRRGNLGFVLEQYQI